MLAGARDAGAGMLGPLRAATGSASPSSSPASGPPLRSCAEEALSLSAQRGQPALAAAPLAWLTLLAALQGRPPTTTSCLADLDDGRPRQPLGHPGRPRARPHPLGARAPAPPTTATPAPRCTTSASIRLAAISRLAAVDRIDAAVRAGDREPGRSLGRGARPVRRAAPAGRGRWPRSTTAAPCSPSRADARRPCSRRALAHHAARQGRPYDRARTHLAYGELLRRTQRRVDARAHLRAALETFEDLRAEPLVARATQELRASGETARKRDPSTLLNLTPMELQGRPAGRPGPVEQGRRRPVLGLAAHRRVPPAQHLHQGRRHLPRRARPARPRLRP